MHSPIFSGNAFFYGNIKLNLRVVLPNFKPNFKEGMQSNHFTDELHHKEFVICSDEDHPQVMDLYVGFNSRGQLVVTCDYTDYEAQEYNCATAAIVDKEDVMNLAKKHEIQLNDVPYMIMMEMDEWREIVNPTIREILDCFTDITECLVDDGCTFKIERKYGKDDFFWI